MQSREVERAGLGSVLDVDEGESLPDGTRLAFGEDVVFTSETLQALVDRAGSGVCRGAVKAGTALHAFAQPFCDGSATDEDLPLPLWAGDLGGKASDALDDEGELAAICDEEDAREIRTAPWGAPPHRLRVPAGRRLGGRFAHWLHVLNLNQAFLEYERARVGAGDKENALLGAADVHPTALVEGSIVADGAAVEHSATVLRSYIGEGVRIADHAVIVDCVIGEGCHTLVDTHFRRVIAYPGSTLSNLGSEDLVLGREVFITTGVAFFQGAPGEDVTIDGVDARRPCVGGAVGDKAVLGARALFARGVAVPSGTVIVMRPDEGLSKLDERGLSRAHMQLGDPSRDA
jgi:carbonic anhydrase/acetyltransferase-like protein (isoleucine patch superfamily)